MVNFLEILMSPFRMRKLAVQISEKSLQLEALRNKVNIEIEKTIITAKNCSGLAEKLVKTNGKGRTPKTISKSN